MTLVAGYSNQWTNVLSQRVLTCCSLTNNTSVLLIIQQHLSGPDLYIIVEARDVLLQKPYSDSDLTFGAITEISVLKVSVEIMDFQEWPHYLWYDAWWLFEPVEAIPSTLGQPVKKVEA